MDYRLREWRIRNWLKETRRDYWWIDFGRIDRNFGRLNIFAEMNLMLVQSFFILIFLFFFERRMIEADGYFLKFWKNKNSKIEKKSKRKFRIENLSSKFVS